MDLLDQSMEMDGNAVGDIKPVSRERSTNTCHRSQSTRSTVSMPRRSRSLSVRHQAARINRSGEKRFSSMADMRRLLMLRVCIDLSGHMYVVGGCIDLNGHMYVVGGCIDLSGHMYVVGGCIDLSGHMYVVWGLY